MKKKTRTGIVVVGAIVVVVAVLAGCVEKEEVSMSTPTPSVTLTPVVTPSPTPTQTPLSEPKYKEGDIIKIPSKEYPLYVWNRTNGNYTLSIITILPFLGEKTKQLLELEDSYIISNATKEFPIRNIDKVTYRVGTLGELKEAEEVPTKFVMGKYLHIDCDGEWSGSYGSIGSSQSIDGEGSDYIPLGDYDYVSAAFQKEEEYGCLKVEIIHDGKVVKSAYTFADYGIVSLSYSF